MVQFSVSIHMANPIHFENLGVVQYFAQKIRGCPFSGKGMGLVRRTQTHIFLVNTYVLCTPLLVLVGLWNSVYGT